MTHRYDVKFLCVEEGSQCLRSKGERVNTAAAGDARSAEERFH